MRLTRHLPGATRKPSRRTSVPSMRGAEEFEIIENVGQREGDVPALSSNPLWGYRTAPIGGVLPTTWQHGSQRPAYVTHRLDAGSRSRQVHRLRHVRHGLPRSLPGLVDTYWRRRQAARQTRRHRLPVLQRLHALRRDLFNACDDARSRETGRPGR